MVCAYKQPNQFIFLIIFQDLLLIQSLQWVFNQLIELNKDMAYWCISDKKQQFPIYYIFSFHCILYFMFPNGVYIHFIIAQWLSI